MSSQDQHIPGHVGGCGNANSRPIDKSKVYQQKRDMGLTTEASGFTVKDFRVHRKMVIDALPKYSGWRYQPALADLYLRFMQQNIRQSKGKWAGEPFEPLPWQDKMLRDVFGTVDCMGIRQYRRLLCWIPKKNGKSTLAAAIGCVMLCEARGAEVYSCATSRDQAALVHSEAVRMVENSPELMDVCRLNRTTRVISLDATQSYYRALSAEAGSAEGINPNCLICDELHVWKGHTLWQTLMYATAAREDALTCVISTAGVYDPESVGYQQYQYARDVLKGEVEDERTYAFIAEAPDTSDWSEPATWAAANPSWGVTIQEDEMLSAYRQAVRIPRYEASFRRYRLNQWVSSAETWIPLRLWEDCRASEWNPQSLEGQVCFGGLDLASERDLGAFVLIFPGETIHVLQWIWTPQKGLERREQQHRVPYLDWCKKGVLHQIPGHRIDQRVIKQKIEDLSELYQIQEIAFDPWNCSQLAVEIEEQLHIDMVKFAQKHTHYNEPMKYMEKLVQDKRLQHDGNPAMAWNLQSVIPDTNAADHTMPIKANASVKIDGIVSLLMALSRVMLSDKQGSIYDRIDLAVI